MTQKYLNELTHTIIGAAIEVHKELGPGLLESVYEKDKKQWSMKCLPGYQKDTNVSYCA